jgi:hypothetical protein
MDFSPWLKQMPAFSLPGLEAFHRAGENPHYRWASVTSEAGDNGVGSRCFKPRLFPKFKLSKTEPAFAIGSCFAQEVQMALLGQGFGFVTNIVDSPVRDFFMQQISASEGRFWPLHFFHRYNVPSMLQEIKRIVHDDSPLNGDALLFPDSKGQVCDFHYHHHFPLASVDQAIARRRFIRERLLELQHCAVFIITLGLTEVWFDKEAGLYLNITPSYPLVSGSPDRFVFMVLSAQEIHDDLCELIAEVRSVAPHIKFVITVSPIPLEGTFAPTDIVVSINHSKASLITAAREIAYSDPDIDYFPSYEMVYMSARDGVWTDDQRHVTPEFVQEIMRHFSESYVE